ncbi:MAG: head GIN domain-containing protein [Chitinophagaceae bacterium]
MKQILLISFLSLAVLSSCRMLSSRSEHGDGNVISQTRNFSGFNGVEVGGAIDVYVTSDSNYSVKVETDQNLQEFVDVFMDGNTLRIGNKDYTNVEPSGQIKVYVSGPAFSKLGASGASNIYSTGRLTSSSRLDIDLSGACSVKLDIKAPEVEVEMSGACNAELTGETKDLRVDGSGSTGLKAFGLLAENVDVDLSGAGDAEVYASVKLNAGTSGAASIEYKGTASVSTDISGAGSVKKVD